MTADDSGSAVPKPQRAVWAIVFLISSLGSEGNSSSRLLSDTEVQSMRAVGIHFVAGVIFTSREFQRATLYRDDDYH